MQAESLRNNRDVCIASGQTKTEGRIPETRLLLQTVGPQEELVELPTPVSAIVTLSAARSGWGGVGNIT
jgi:hypothetical protein